MPPTPSLGALPVPKDSETNVAGFWKLFKIYIFNSGRDPRDPPNRPGKADPDPPNIVEKQ